MSIREFRRAGHWPTLLAAFIYFDLSFCIWYLLGPLGNFIAEDLQLSATQKGFLIATPLLGGSIFRILMGGLTDHLGPRRTGMIGITLTFVPLLLGWLVADTLPRLFVVALLLGIPGASFAVALPLASRWYPPQYQGLVMGIAGAGNSGTVLASLFMPRLAAMIGWQAAMGLAILPMAAAGAVFFLCAKDSPNQPPPKRWTDYLAVLREVDTIWFCLFYSITFGGFVGLASFLGVFFHDQYLVDKVRAGDLTALCVFAGSFMRPVGGCSPIATAASGCWRGSTASSPCSWWRSRACRRCGWRRRCSSPRSPCSAPATGRSSSSCRCASSARSASSPASSALPAASGASSAVAARAC
jgi:NNP family nitrate/nitrite transporter-like MFS transporter